MEVMEKLVKIVCDAMESDGCIGHCNHSPCFEVERVVNALLDNGVTVQEWISVEDRLPEEEGWYLVFTTPNREHKSINKAMFCKGYAWGNFEPYWRGAGGHWANVTHWMPIPLPPKGE